MNGHLPLEELKKREGEIFGGTGDGMGKSKVSLRVIPNDMQFGKLTRLDLELKYMAYGAEDRQFIDVGSKFKVEFIVRTENETADSEIAEQVKLAFSALSYFGGLGAKSRNAFGAFTSNNLIPFDDFKSRAFIHYSPTIFTAFSMDCQYYVTENRFDNWQDLIKELADIYKNYGRKEVAKNKRQHIGAPYENQKPPERHSKLFLMSAIKSEIEDDMLKGIITFLPYEYLSKYPELPSNQENRLRNDWQGATEAFKKGIYNSKTRNGHYYLKTLLD
jgi:CRISPR-associated protein Cmr1